MVIERWTKNTRGTFKLINQKTNENTWLIKKKDKQ